MMRLAYILALKDWRLFWADRRAALLCFAVPILLASAFGVIFDHPPGERKLPVALVCECDNPAVKAFIERVKNSPRFELIAMSRAEADVAVADRRPGLAVIIPATFTMPTLLGERPKLQLLHHPLNAAECAWAEGALTEAVLASLGLPSQSPIDTETRAVGSVRFNAYAHSFSGMTLQYLLFWGMESGLLLLRERQRGVWRRVRTAPVPLAAILLGKTLSTTILALLQVLVTFAFGTIAFDVPIGSPLAFLGFAVVISLLAAATGLLVATLGGTEARARSVCILGILGISMVGGLWLPQFLLPGWARDLALTLPTTWAMRGLESVTWNPNGLWLSAVAVLAFTLVFLLFAAWRFARGETRRQEGWAT